MRRRSLLGAALLAAPAVRAQDLPWPSRPVKFVNPFPPGGPGDTYARLVAEHCSRTLGQPFLVENRAGATGAVGTAMVMRSPPEGHTLLFTSNSGFFTRCGQQWLTTACSIAGLRRSNTSGSVCISSMVRPVRSHMLVWKFGHLDKSTPQPIPWH